MYKKYYAQSDIAVYDTVYIQVVIVPLLKPQGEVKIKLLYNLYHRKNMQSKCAVQWSRHRTKKGKTVDMSK